MPVHGRVAADAHSEGRAVLTREMAAQAKISRCVSIESATANIMAQFSCYFEIRKASRAGSIF